MQLFWMESSIEVAWKKITLTTQMHIEDNHSFLSYIDPGE